MSIDPAVRAQSLLDTPSDEWGRDGDRLTWVLDARHALRGLLIARDAEEGRADLLADTLRLRTAALNRVVAQYADLRAQVGALADNWEHGGGPGLDDDLYARHLRDLLADPGEKGPRVECGTFGKLPLSPDAPNRRVHNHPPYEPICNERRVGGQLRGACLNDDGGDR